MWQQAHDSTQEQARLQPRAQQPQQQQQQQQQQPQAGAKRSRAARKRHRQAQLDEAMWRPPALTTTQQPLGLQRRDSRERACQQQGQLRTEDDDGIYSQRQPEPAEARMIRLAEIPSFTSKRDVRNAMERIAPLKSFHAAESTAYVEFLSVKGAQAALEMAAAHGGTIEISSSVRVILTQPTTKHLGAGSIPTQPSVSHQEWFASVLSAPVAPISDNSNDRVDTTTEVSKKMSTATICVPPTRRSKEVSDPASSSSQASASVRIDMTRMSKSRRKARENAEHIDKSESRDVVPSRRPQHVCMLCLRKFPSRENLERHEQRSLMHKQALAKRSGRRRRPVTEAIVPSKLADPSPPELAPLPASSKGSQLLSKLGWVAGSGAGVRAQGITAPLSASGMGGRTASTRHGLGAVDARKPS